ncbi:hypothetical protein [Paractinoplanes atraurantiacus]|uniref:Uncharacterized protein n=1 Tax=Paractinoplanes atraurantiacus TaxID=1036182 RepID=A0A285IM69_9ACTN|nr:hypothetical protein [Actinoplanes atraurantiacus]SNY48061.1 hypothetical protein SAMN05421748_108282 [Actinoplanes atraurantiacus]
MEGDRIRALPYEDLAALVGVVAVLNGHLVNGELPEELIQHLHRRLVGSGQPTGGAVNGVLSDLADRLHWAAGAGAEYPRAGPRPTRYEIRVPAVAVAALCCRAS